MATCDGPECTNDARANGLCGSHDSQRRRKGELTPLRAKRASGATADRDGCGRKMCSLCKQWLHEDAYRLTAHAADGLSATCTRCNTLRPYGLTTVSYDALLVRQGGVCLGCATAPKAGEVLRVDHDHACCPGRKRSCGKCVRGLLCHGCNAALGLVKDSATTLLRLAAYIG